jgi:YidC/Oxa1 family membrane protein insertase
MMLPIIFTFLLARFPSGLVIYWAWNNTLSIGQQWVIMRGVAKADAAKKAATGTPKAAAAKSGKGGKKGDDEPAPADADSDAEPEAAEGKAEPKTTTSAARGKHRGRGKRRTRGGRR